MNKLVFSIAFGFVTIATFGQKIDLEWKIGAQEKLSYMTVMSEIDTASVDVNFNGLSRSFSDSTGRGISEVKDFFEKLNDAYKNVDLLTTLKNRGDGVVDIVMVASRDEQYQLKADTSDRRQRDIIKALQAMTQGVALRGSVFATGGMHSFWVKSNQKNLISVFFELPTKPVRVGDEWELDINLIANDQNFACDSAYKRNRVTLTDIRKVQGERIAVLKYDIVEYVKGPFTAPAFGGKGGTQTETMMKFTYQAIAEFSIDKGRWVSYDGIMTLVASGVMNANKKTKFTLIRV